MNDSLESAAGKNTQNREDRQQDRNPLQIRLLGSFDSQSRAHAGQNAPI